MAEPVNYRFSSRGLGPGEQLEVVSFQGQEGLSRLYSFTIELKSRSAELDLDALLAQAASLTLEVGGKVRVVHGVLSEFEELDQSGEYTLYRTVLVPRLWQLSLYRTNEVYLEQNVPETIETVLEEAGFTSADYELRLMRSYRTWPYRCQFGETHLDFISRLMEHEGIYYYFVQEAAGEKLILCDHRQFNDDLPEPGVRYSPPSGMDLSQYQDKVHSLVCRQTRLPRHVLLRDYNDDNPSVDIKGEATVDERGVGEVYAYGDNIETPEEGKELAEIRAEEIRAGKRLFHGEGTVARLTPGFVCQLEQHFRESFNGRYLILSVAHEGYSPSLLAAGDERPAYANSFSAIPSDVQYRPERRTAKPRFYGTLNAIIDGEGDGKYAEVDDQGRYKVVLTFDRIRRQEGKASHWVRMAQPYAGEGEGMHFPLRKGAEVLLTFVGGDPDRPIISGAVPNARAPSVVTADNQTNSKIKTGGGNFIELEDREDSKRIKLYSPHNNTYFHLGAPNHDGDGVTLLTLGLVRNEWLGGQLQTIVTKDNMLVTPAATEANPNPTAQAPTATGANNDQYDERTALYTFKVKNDNGAGTTAMTAAQELSGDYVIQRRKGPLYVWTDGNEHIYGGGKVFNFGNSYEESHWREDGIDAHGETWSVPASMPGAPRWAPADHFVEKVWGDTYEYHKGHSYSWTDGNSYEFGSSYTEVHIGHPSTLAGSHSHDSYNGEFVQITPSEAAVEKIIGDCYNYVDGRTLEIFNGRFEERFHGQKHEFYYGALNEVFIGIKNEFALSPLKQETNLGLCNAFNLSISNEMTAGVKSEIFFGAALEYTMASKIDMCFGAKMEIDLATKIDVPAGSALETAANKLQAAATRMKMTGSSLESVATFVANRAVNIDNGATWISNKVISLIN